MRRARKRASRRATRRAVGRAIGTGAAAGLLVVIAGCGGGSRVATALPEAEARREGYAALLRAAGEGGRRDAAAEEAIAGAASLDAYRAAVIAAVARLDDPRAAVAWTDGRPAPPAGAAFDVVSDGGAVSTIPGVHGLLGLEGALWIVLRPEPEPSAAEAGDPGAPGADDGDAADDADVADDADDADPAPDFDPLAPVILPPVVAGRPIAAEEAMKPAAAADGSRDAIDLADVPVDPPAAAEPAPPDAGPGGEGAAASSPASSTVPTVSAVDDLPRRRWLRLDRFDGRSVGSPDLAIAWLRLAGHGAPLRLTVTDPVTGAVSTGPAPRGPWRRLRWSDAVPPDVPAPRGAPADPENGTPQLAEPVRVLPFDLGRIVLMRRAGGGRAAWWRPTSFGDCSDPEACATGERPCPVRRAVVEAVARATASSSLVLDLRGCGEGACHHVDPLLDRLLPPSVVRRPVRHGTAEPPAGPPAGRSSDASIGGSSDGSVDASDRYAGRLVLLVDEGTAGPAEHVAAAFEPIREVTTIGVPTAGSRCARVVVELPGGLMVRVGGPPAIWDDGWSGHAGRPVQPDVPLLVDGRQRTSDGPVAAGQTRSARQVAAGLGAIGLGPSPR